MRSASASTDTDGRSVAALLTDGESTFRNPKLHRASLVAYKAAADAAGKGSLFVITILAARQLTPREFGVFGLGTTLGWMLSVTADFGIQMHLARAVAAAPDAADLLLRRWWRVRVVATIGSVGALLGAMLAFHADPALAIPLTVFAAAYACTSLVELLNYYYRGLSRSDIESTLTIAQRAITLTVAGGVLLWRPNVTLLAIAMLVPAGVALLWSSGIAARIGRPPTATLAILPDSFARDVFPIGLGIVLSALYFRIDVLLIQAWLGTEAVAGYNAVFRVIDALRLFPAALLAVVLPVLCRADSFAPLAAVAAWTAGFGLAAAIAIWTTADTVVPMLFGAQYQSVVPVFRILALSFPLMSLNLALTHQLVGWNRQHAYALVCGIGLAVNLALNAWLIPAWSVAGAAWSTLGTECCVTLGCAAALARARR